jgi:TolA-binding protein
MSLLMEALRKAEEAKRRMQQEQLAGAGKEPGDVAQDSAAAARPATPSFALEEREADVTPDYILENFTSNPDAGSASVQNSAQSAPDISTASQPEPPPPMAEREPSARNLARRQQRNAAASVFVAKQNPARNRKTLTILVIVMVLMIPLGGGVLWYVQAASQPSIGINPTIASYDLSTRGFIDEAPAPEAAVALPPQVPVEPALGAPSEALAVPTDTVAAQGDTPDPALAFAVGDTPPVPNTDAEEEFVPPSLPSTETAVAVAPPAAAASTLADTGADVTDSALALPQNASPTVLQISRSGGARQINPGVSTAYASLQAGDLAAAGAQYQQVLDSLPNSRDALLGLGLVRLREGQLAAARELYARALQLNPRDPLAHTGLLQTMQAVTPSEHESTLRTLIDQYPDVAPLPLALGNLYASQQRWSEAQGAYYNALLIASRNSSGPVNPDYAFNLAVSLEQLNQGKAALGYYRQAQALAREVTPGFDPQLLTSRLDFLQGQDQP